jgi:hypothetical protein
MDADADMDMDTNKDRDTDRTQLICSFQDLDILHLFSVKDLI